MVKVSLGIPGFFKLEGELDQHEMYQKAAWELYVELITRIAFVELEEDKGILREAFSSLYSLFESTRDILKMNGPILAIGTKNDSTKLSIGHIAIYILNVYLRPFLTRWHPLLEDH